MSAIKILHMIILIKFIRHNNPKIVIEPVYLPNPNPLLKVEKWLGTSAAV
jgi:hypothetical protein